MEDEKVPSPRQRRPKLNESERTMIEYLWNVERLSQSEIGRQLHRSQSIIARELQSGNTVDYSHLSRRELLNMPIHARIKYSAARGQYNSVQKAFRFGQGSKLTPELKKLIEHWINDEKWTPEQVSADIEDVLISQLQQLDNGLTEAKLRLKLIGIRKIIKLTANVTSHYDAKK